MKKQEVEIKEDTWIPSLCGRCYCQCAIMVRRVNGVAVKIEGNPESTMGAGGGICAKGAAGLQVLYDPNRLNFPLRRTNPEKGLFVDPKWKRISWDEAFEEIVPRLKKIIAENPKKLLRQFSVIRSGRQIGVDIPFGFVIGDPTRAAGGASLHCGQGAHEAAGLLHLSWSVVPDFKYCNYAMLFGASKGHAAGHSAMLSARLSAEAKARGMKLVVFDPLCNFAGGKATEWVPIIPGTDGAVALAMCNVIVNDLKTWDAVYLKTKTNAPYLIGPDGHYVREKSTKTAKAATASEFKGPYGVTGAKYLGENELGKPLVWDAGEGKAKPYDDTTVVDYALEGEYEVAGVRCQPAFQLLREHLKKYTPEMASEVSTIPARTIRRIAEEFAQAARIGSTIVIDGKELPFRPVSAVVFRGGQGHEKSLHTCFAVHLLNQIVGAADVPGGTVGWPARSLGHPGTGKPSFSPMVGEDGFLTSTHFGPHGMLKSPWPPRMPENLGDVSLKDIIPMSIVPFVVYSGDQDEIWEKTGCSYRIEMMLSWGCNVVLSLANWQTVAEALKKIPFIVTHELFNNEFTEGFTDIVLPGTCYLEEPSCEAIASENFNHAYGMEDWSYHITQPVVEPVYERRSYDEFLLELTDRLGLREQFNQFWNRVYLDKNNQLEVKEGYPLQEMFSRLLKTLFGPEHDWDWFEQHGFIRWPKKVEEAYWRYFVKGRVPSIYLEWMLDMHDRLEKINSETGLNIDLSQYTPLISWSPGSIHRVDNPEYDLYCFSYRDILHTGSCTMEQPWIDEASRINPYTYNITMNAETAKKKGLRDGDVIKIESAYGRTVEGVLKLMQGQHPQTVAIAACSGHWAKGQPVAKGKGPNFDVLLELDLDHIDPTCQNIETCVRVKVQKVGKASKVRTNALY